MSEEKDWIPTSEKVPDENEVVYAKDSRGHVQKLKRIGRMWWFEDGEMYVYFVPQFWKPIKKLS